MFDWERDFVMKPTRSLVKFLRHLCRATAFAHPRPHNLILDNLPEASLLMRNYPELRAFRDINTWWKFFLNSDVSTFSNYSSPKEPRDVGVVDRLKAQLRWGWSEEEKGYQVTALDGNQVIAPQFRPVL